MRCFLLAQAMVLGAAASAAAAPRPPDFATEIVPILTRAGCNSGACHGAATGRGGFRLSLLGEDPASDYDRLVLELEGRRVNRARPDRSLILLKPSMQLDHEGGNRLPRSSPEFTLVREWIAAGAPRGGGRILKTFTVTPTVITLARPGHAFALQVLAGFDADPAVDVTWLALLTPADPSSLKIDRQHRVTAIRAGLHTLSIRFLDRVSSVTVLVPYQDHGPMVGDAPRARANFIDDHVNQTLAALRLPAAPRADDRALVRRLYLDLIGTLPTPEEADAFANDPRPDKLPRLLDVLLRRPEFTDHWAYKFSDLFRVESRRMGPEGAAAFHSWLRRQLAENVPFDRIAREMLLAEGDAFTHGPANFWRVGPDPRAQAEYVTQSLMGVRLGCANCHNHPFDRWTQDDYHGLASVFARLERGRVVRSLARGAVIHPRTGEAAPPRLPGQVLAKDEADPRRAFSDWLLARDNPYFARNVVNRLWAAMMGRGLVEPLDDLRATNPPSHPGLLSELAADFASNGYDLRRTLRTIALSEAYCRSSRRPAGSPRDDRYYDAANVKPLPPPVLVDAVAQVTGVPEKLGGLPEGARAIALGDSRVASRTLDLLGRCSRDEGCAGTERGEGLPAALYRLSGPWLQEKVAAPQGRLHNWMGEGKSNAEIVAGFYRLALGRPPTEKEAAHWSKRLPELPAAVRTAALEDFLWALLNSAEFNGNH